MTLSDSTLQCVPILVYLLSVWAVNIVLFKSTPPSAVLILNLHCHNYSQQKNNLNLQAVSQNEGKR